jgi:hypothetical protein
VGACFTYGTRPGVGTMVVGLNGLVIGVLASVTIDLGAEDARAKIPATVALAAFINRARLVSASADISSTQGLVAS